MTERPKQVDIAADLEKSADELPDEPLEFDENGELLSEADELSK